MLFERQALHIQVQRVVGQPVQDDVCADVACHDVMRGELAGCGSHVLAMEADAAVPEDE